MKPLTTYKIKVEQKSGKNAGKLHFLIIRTENEARLTVPRGYRLVYVVSEN